MEILQAFKDRCCRMYIKIVTCMLRRELQEQHCSQFDVINVQNKQEMPSISGSYVTAVSSANNISANESFSILATVVHCMKWKTVSTGREMLTWKSEAERCFNATNSSCVHYISKEVLQYSLSMSQIFTFKEKSSNQHWCKLQFHCSHAKQPQVQAALLHLNFLSLNLTNKQSPVPIKAAF